MNTDKLKEIRDKKFKELPELKPLNDTYMRDGEDGNLMQRLEWKTTDIQSETYQLGRDEVIEEIIKLDLGLQCPNCPNEGQYAVCGVDENDIYPEQCEYCYTVEGSKFFIKNKLTQLKEQK